MHCGSRGLLALRPTRHDLTELLLRVAEGLLERTARLGQPLELLSCRWHPWDPAHVRRARRGAERAIELGNGRSQLLTLGQLLDAENLELLEQVPPQLVQPVSGAGEVTLAVWLGCVTSIVVDLGCECSLGRWLERHVSCCHVLRSLASAGASPGEGIGPGDSASGPAPAACSACGAAENIANVRGLGALPAATAGDKRRTRGA